MISVIVPVYKVERYLRECVDSILMQTFTDFELILVDDGSPDRCPQICDEYAARDSRVKVIHQANGGLSAARNAGIEIAQGEYLTFIDSDDYVSPAYLQKLYDALIENHAGLSVCLAVWFIDGEPAIDDCCVEKTICVMTGREACFSIYRSEEKVANMAWGKLFHRNLFSSIRFPEGKIHEDVAVIPRIVYQAQTVVALAERLYFYRNRLDSITSQAFSIKKFDEVDGVECCKKFFSAQNDIEMLCAAENTRQQYLSRHIFSALKHHAGTAIPVQYQMAPISLFRFLRKMRSEEDAYWYLKEYHPCLWAIHIVYAKIRKISKI